MNSVRHIAIILDGNGRFSQKLNKSRSYGHKLGIKNISTISDEVYKLKIKYITFFCFSIQNWKRSHEEITNLINYIDDEIKTLNSSYNENKKKFIIRFIGNLNFNNVNIAHYPRIKSVIKQIKQINDKFDSENKSNKTILTFAINYGAKEEIIDAVNLILKNKKITIVDEIMFNKYLWTNYLPDVDILIRTSGEQRISNFLLWKISYSELFFTKTQWPEFDSRELKNIINDFLYKRKRRFGGYDKNN